MRKYLGIVSILVFLLAYWIYKAFIYGTDTGALPLFTIAYVVSVICWWFSDQGIWKIISAIINILIPAAIVLLIIVLIVHSFSLH